MRNPVFRDYLAAFISILRAVALNYNVPGDISTTPPVVMNIPRGFIES